MVVHTSTVTARTMINEAAVTPSIPGQILNDSSLVLLCSPLPENPSAVKKNRALVMAMAVIDENHMNQNIHVN